MQREIVHGADPWDLPTWSPRTHTVHERATKRTEGISHCVSGCDCLVLSVFGEFILSTEMFETGILDNEIGCKHGRGDFTAVGTIADEGID